MGRPTLNWKGLIFNDCEILAPVNEDYVRGIDLWNIKCPYDNNIFEAKPVDIKSGKFKHCGCRASISYPSGHISIIGNF